MVTHTLLTMLLPRYSDAGARHLHRCFHTGEWRNSQSTKSSRYPIISLLSQPHSLFIRWCNAKSVQLTMLISSQCSLPTTVMLLRSCYNRHSTVYSAPPNYYSDATKSLLEYQSRAAIHLNKFQFHTSRQPEMTSFAEASDSLVPSISTELRHLKGDWNATWRLLAASRSKPAL